MLRIKPVIGIFLCCTFVLTLEAQAGRATVAILPFQNKAGIDPHVADSLVDMLTTSLTQTQKFDVVERTSLESVVEELNLSESGLVDPKTAAEWGKLKGADYLIIGAVTEAGQGKGGMGFGRIKLNTSSVALAIDVRFVDSSTSSVVFADSFREERKGLGFKFLSMEFDPQSEKGSEMARAVVVTLTKKIMRSVYPPKVIKVAEATNEVTLNYGEVVFEPGQLWGVYTLGEEVIDPDTGESLGRDETKIGQIKITSSLTKLSKASVVSGSAHAGAVCRRDAPAPKTGVKKVFKKKKRGRR